VGVTVADAPAAAPAPAAIDDAPARRTTTGDI